MSAERGTRERPSRIDRFPDEIRERINAMLRGGVPQREIMRRLEGPLREIGEEPLSGGGISRYAKRMAKVGRRIREYRAMYSRI